ncbi:MAG: TonB family protein [Rikenellaceae bacterium]
MNYYKQDDNSSRRWGVVAMLLYFVGVVCLLLFVKFGFENEELEQEGILINFGVSDTGSGVRDLAATDVVAPTPQTTSKANDEMLTDESSDVELPAPTPSPTPTPEEVVEQPQTVNKRALFPGRTESSNATSQGDSQTPQQGNQGDKSGTPDGASTGSSNEGLSGDSYNLEGRSLVGTLPKPAYNDNSSGKVVIEVVVNDEGSVTSASYRAQGSTTNSSTLIDAARKAAMNAKFSKSDAAMQSGTITYVFKME